MTRPFFFLLLGILAALSGCDMGPSGVNGNATIPAGQKTGAVSRVNGRIEIGAGATAEGVNTVNGSITVGSRATIQSANTVNGSITLHDGAKALGGINTVNGSLTLHNGAEVAGGLTNVNGDIKLDHAHVAGGIESVGADIEVGAESRVEGGIQLRKSSGISLGLSEPPRIVIGPGAVVGGRMKFERPVKLYVSDTATIGAVEGATPQKFSGPDAPQ